jgi:hypothetical protein
MSIIPFEMQLLPVNPVDQIEYKIAHGEAVSGEELLDAIEQLQGHRLDDRLRDVVRKFSVSAVKRRGRPRSNRGLQDFGMEKLDKRYPALLQKFRREDPRGSKADHRSPSERAYRHLAAEMHEDFGGIDWRALSNLHSKWKHGHFHSEEGHVDSEDFEAEIERQFPAPERS